MENWRPVIGYDDEPIVNGNGILFQNINSGDVGYLEDNKENCNALGITPRRESASHNEDSNENSENTNIYDASKLE
ncbi:hypothetical protein HHI36_010233 [Cryptolaemus montrouzieri]|uniref:Uncharacterized protein n=1 Tax=Cryptolaemus montrouzieri TaxID=559131 RepID=A0ABD2MI30_9CUCU